MTNNSIIPNFDEAKCGDLTLRLHTIDHHDTMLLVACSGYIDTYNTPYFQEKVEIIFRNGYNKIIFDLGGISYVSSTGIGAFVGFIRSLDVRGGDICFVNMQPNVYDVFQLLGFSTFFKFSENLDQAILKLSTPKLSERDIIFPKTFQCPICSKRLIAKKSGKFRCPDCRSIIGINDKAKVFIV